LRSLKERGQKITKLESTIAEKDQEILDKEESILESHANITIQQMEIDSINEANMEKKTGVGVIFSFLKLLFPPSRAYDLFLSFIIFNSGQTFIKTKKRLLF
jgi:hypothetical protein